MDDENFESPPTCSSIHSESVEPVPVHEHELMERLGRYRILSKLGSGGFGVVYKGFDEDLRREVAIKVPHRDRLAAGNAQTYLNEGRILASLNHPNIVPVYDVGRTNDGLCYLVSQFVDGTDLSGWLREQRPDQSEAVAIVSSVAQALHHAHRNGLVHRDIKPANILRARDGRIVVADFGLALREEDFGKGGGYAGTPIYMSPEQARCEGHRVDGRSDVYSLGVVFYELLTGKRPFTASAIGELLEQIKHQEPRPPRQVDDSIPRELDRICLKCLSKRAADRYSTAIDLADDLEQWSKGAPAAAIPKSSLPAPTEIIAASDRATGPALLDISKIAPKGLCSFGPDDADSFLRLLPGPCNRDGLPESLAYWKYRIESNRAEEAFRVGLLYGPSGCGKTSLVRAGLLPRLALEVTPVYLEASADGVEAGLLALLTHTCPVLEGTSSLSDAVAALRCGKIMAGGRKLLVIIDQFEQWLHAAGTELAAQPLVAALRQADGLHVQFLLLIRDDFWLGAARLFQELEIPLHEGHNIRLADLFDARHARTVLELFGQGYGCLPEETVRFTPEHRHFLDQAIQGLGEDGMVVPVRLSVFADMLKHRPWSPRTLEEIGGADGAGVTFLEETFSARTANPERRSFQAAARSVLAALLPEAGGAIKGRMRSRDELAQAAELSPHRFQRLLEILDRELHIITPTEAASPEQGNKPAYYHLTHDYLVCPLRDWLTQKQRASWRGRAELALDERTAQWRRRRERRFLPSPFEHLTIAMAVPRRRRKPDQQALLRASARHYGMISLALFMLVCLLGWSAHEIKGRAQAQRLVQELLAVAPQTAEKLVIEEFPAYQRWAEPLLRELATDSNATREHRLRASLALLPVDRKQVEFLQASLNDGSLDAYPTLRDEFLVPAASQDRAHRVAFVSLAQAILNEPSDPRSEIHRAELGRRQARAAVLLIRLGQVEAALRACRDLECLGQFAAHSRQFGIDAAALLNCLDRAADDRERYAVLLALGNFTLAELPQDRRQATIDKLIDGYQRDNSSVCHAAYDWLLRHWGVAPPLAKLPAAKAPPPLTGKRQWFVLEVEDRRLSFVSLPPGKFLMGSPASEKYRVADEKQHRVEISRPLGVLDREVGVWLWNLFLDETGRGAAWTKRDARGAAFQQDDHPAVHLDWNEAVEFCRWLTRKVGLPESEQCYAEVHGADTAGRWRFCPERAGFRLPTEAEWEYACRGDSTSVFSFGSAHALLADYAVFLDNSKRQPAHIGTTRPNPRGLFDMHGNVWEWCSDSKANYAGSVRDPIGPLTGPVRQYRGGSYDNFSRHSRCACRISEQLTARFPYLGFRVVCTLPTFETTASH